MRALYIVATWIVIPLALPVLALSRKTRDGFWQRLGFYRSGDIPQGPGPLIWLHGASAGDLLALAPMIRRLRDRVPGVQILLSTITNSGYLMARERLKGQIDSVVYAPYDLWGATRRAMRAARPQVLILEYTEIWPNLIRAASRAGAAVVLTNGRFSPARLAWYRALFKSIGNPLRDLSLLLMREQEEAERALLLGARRDAVLVTGNTKFDALVGGPVSQDDAELERALGLRADAPVWMLGSTHEGEEEGLLEVYRRLRENIPTLQLVVAPRYIDRAPRIVDLAQQAGFPAALRSQGNAERRSVIVLDSIGELSRAYRLATVVFVGGSFIDRGGQNILEPAAQGKAVLFGPRMENFKDSVQVLIGRGGIQVNDTEHLFRVLHDLLGRPQDLAALGERAANVVQQISGASDRNVEKISALVRPVTR